MPQVAEGQSFVDRWVNYVSDRTEAPREFHKYMAYLAVSVALGRRAWMPWAGGRLFPNLYFLTLAKSASFKSTAINNIKKVIRRIDQHCILPDDFTDASLNLAIFKYQEGLITLDEFSRLLKAEDGPFANVKTVFTSVYDCPESYRLPYRVQDREGDTRMVPYPVFSIAAASTADSVVKTLDLEDLRGGFMTRFFFITGSASDNSIPIPPGDDDDQINAFATALRQLRDTAVLDPHRPIGIADCAKAVYAPWYNRLKFLMEDHGEYRDLASSINRIRHYAVKFAMLNAIVDWSTEDPHPVIRAANMEKGIEIAEEGIRNLMTCMGNLECTSSKDRLVQMMAQVREYCKVKRQEITRADIYDNVKKLDKRNLSLIIETMVDAHELELHPAPNGSSTYNYIRRTL